MNREAPIVQENKFRNFRDNFEYEFELLLNYTCFVRAYWELFPFQEDVSAIEHAEPLTILFGAVFDGIALSLNRIWDFRKDDPHMLSIPSLVQNHEKDNFFGAYCLKRENEGRKKYDRLVENPLRQRLRVARTETLAHSIAVGNSKDRERSEDIRDTNEFRLPNDEVIGFADETCALLLLILSEGMSLKQRYFSGLSGLRQICFNGHIELLQKSNGE